MYVYPFIVNKQRKPLLIRARVWVSNLTHYTPLAYPLTHFNREMNYTNWSEQLNLFFDV